MGDKVESFDRYFGREAATVRGWVSKVEMGHVFTRDDIRSLVERAVEWLRTRGTSSPRGTGSSCGG